MDDETLRSCIARMVAAKERMAEPRDQLNDLRREARAEGANIKALNPLIDILCENPHDRGTKVLRDLIHYARIAGTELPIDSDVVQSGTSSRSVSGDQLGIIAEQEGPKSDLRSRPRSPRQYLPPSIRFAFDGLLGGCLSVFLIWLLH